MPARIDPTTFDGTVVYTDGACSGNPGPGGWAWAIEGGAQASGGDPRTTNQRMELTAALEAVRACDGPLLVVSDSTYVVNCFRDNWWKGWLARGWTNSQKKPVANRDLWEPLIEAFRERGDVSFTWVKGHSGHVMNDLVDRLAVAAAVAQGGSPVQPGSSEPTPPPPAVASSAGTSAVERAMSRGAAADTGMLDLFDDGAVKAHKARIYDALLAHVLRDSRAALNLRPATSEADDDAQRQALDEVTAHLRRLAG